MYETGVPGENHRPDASHWQTLSHNVVSSCFNARSPTGSYFVTFGHIILTSSYCPCSLTRRVLRRNSKSHFIVTGNRTRTCLQTRGPTHLPILHQGGCNCFTCMVLSSYHSSQNNLQNLGNVYFVSILSQCGSVNFS